MMSEIEQIARGDQPAFGRFYDQYAALVFSFALKFVRNRADAEDLLQEVFLQVWRNASTYNSRRGSPEAWLLTITRSRAIDKLRSQRRKNRDAILLEDLSQIPQPPGTAAAPGDRVTLGGLLEKVSEAQRTALELAYFSGMTQAEIAEHLRIPLGTVKTRIRDGLRQLRAQVEGLPIHQESG